jgi:hypothetical protein
METKKDKRVHSTFALNFGRRLALKLASCPNWWTAELDRGGAISRIYQEAFLFANILVEG